MDTNGTSEIHTTRRNADWQEASAYHKHKTISGRKKMTWYRQRTENSGQRLLGLAVSTAHGAFYVKELFKATDTVVAPGWQNRDSHCKCLFSYFTGFSIQINYASFISLESEAQKSILLQSSPEAFEKLPDMSECK